MRIAGRTELTDPFLSVDHFRMTGRTFPPHPHAGFAGVTYMFDDAQTGFESRDSMGGKYTIRPGDSHWAVACSGVIHEETPREPGRTAHGLQVFVNLPEAMHAQPAYSNHQNADERPVVERDSVRRIVVFGRDGGIRAPLEIPVDVSLVDVQMDATARHTLYPDAERTMFLLLIGGAIDVGGKKLAAGEACTIEGELELSAAERTKFVLFEGAPLRQPVVFVGPVAMTSEERANRVMNRYRQGLLGRLD